MPIIPVLTARWKPVYQSLSIHPWVSDILLSNPEQSFVLQIPKSEATLPIWLLLSFIDFFFFFDVDQFKSLFWICYNIASAVCFGVLATGDLSSLTRARTPPSTSEGEVLTWENLNFRTKWFFIFYYFWLHWVFVAARGLCSGHRLLFCYGAQALELAGFSSCSWTTREVQNGSLNP